MLYIYITNFFMIFGFRSRGTLFCGVLLSTSIDSYSFESIKICLNINWNCNFVDLLHHPFWLQLVFSLLEHHFQLFQLLCLAKDHWWEFSTRNAHMVHIVNINPDLKWCIHLDRRLFLYCKDTYSKSNYTAEDIITMLQFLVDNIFVLFAGKMSNRYLTFQWAQTVHFS